MEASVQTAAQEPCCHTHMYPFALTSVTALDGDKMQGSHAIKTLCLSLLGLSSGLGIFRAATLSLRTSFGNHLNERTMVVALDIVEVRENPRRFYHSQLGL